MIVVTNKKALRALNSYPIGQRFRHCGGTLSELVGIEAYQIVCKILEIHEGFPEGWLNRDISFALNAVQTSPGYRIEEAL